MQRVRFLTSQGQYARGANVTLSDEEAEKAIKLGHAVKGDPIKSVGGEVSPKSEPIARVIFLKPFKDGETPYPKDARATLPASVAAKAIAEGKAKAFPITSVGDSPQAEPVKPIRTGKREPITA